MSNTTKRKSTIVRISEVADPAARLHRRLTGNVARAQQALDYWTESLERTKSLAPSNSYSAQHLPAAQRKVAKLQLELEQATAELAVFEQLVAK